MPLNSEPLPTDSQEHFCYALKAARERKGISLDEIEKATKIPAYLFAALERCDLRRWPHGLFRRSFFRDYARMIDVPVTDACNAFVQLFVDEAAPLEVSGVQEARGGSGDVRGGLPEVRGGSGEVRPASGEVRGGSGDVQAGSGIRLMLDSAWHGPRAPLLSRLFAAVLDTGAVLAVAVFIAWIAGMNRSTTIAVVALTYFSLANTVLAESPAQWLLARRRTILDAVKLGPSAIAAAWRHSVDAVTHAFDRNRDRQGTEYVPDPPAPEWVSDARRVGPAPASRLRVRIKLPQ
jgi:hypothetical protein